MEGTWRWLAAWLQALMMAGVLAGCGSDDEPDPEPPTEPTPLPGGMFSIGGTVSGLTSGEVALGLYLLDGQAAQQISSGNGAFTFPQPLPDGSEWGFFASVVSDEPQRCGPDPLEGIVAGANVHIEVTCVAGHTIGGRVFGLRGSGLDLRLEWDRTSGGGGNAQQLPGQDGPYVFGHGLLSGESYRVYVHAQPQNPTQRCVVANGTGVVADSPVSNVNVECGEAQISYAVEGMLGAGLTVALYLEVSLNGNTQMLLVEEDGIDADGTHTFDTLVSLGDRYEVRVVRQPEDPDQMCQVLRATGEVVGDVNDVLVRCPDPLRTWRFDNEYTRDTPEPLIPAGERRRGIVDEYYLFRHGQVIQLGSVSGLDTEELFALYLDGPGSGGYVHSNATGKTFWVAAESPPAADLHVIGTAHSHVVTLDTVWRFRKVAPATRFALEVTALNMLAFDDTHSMDAWGSLWAGGEMRVSAHHADGDEISNLPFFTAHGAMHLKGSLDGQGANTVWRLVPRVDAQAVQHLWRESDFGLDVRTGPDVAYASLLNSVPIEIDLGELPVGAEFLVKAEAVVEARNSYSPEGATAAFLRDPAQFETGQPPGGVSLAITEGVVMVEPAEVDLTGLQFVGPAAPECAAGSPRATLAFEVATARIEEGVNRGAGVRVTRSGSVEGLVTARVRLAPGTATAGADFEARDLEVRFGNGSDEPRTIDLPIVHDDLAEDDETLTLTLDEPVGCADIGALDTIAVTIEDDDQPRTDPTYTLGGTVSGLAGSGLVITNLSTDDLPLASDGPFAFARTFATGARYEVRVASQPANPRQFCAVANGSGTIASADVNDLTVACTTLPEGTALDPTFGDAGRVTSSLFPAATGMTLQPDGRILVVGRGRLGRFNVDGTVDAGFGTNGEVVVSTYSSPPDVLNDVQVQPDGKILIAGHAIDGANSPTWEDWLIARYEAGGGPDASFNGGQPVIVNFARGDTATDILLRADGSMIVTGGASILDSFGVADSNFAARRFLVDGSSDTNFGVGGNAIVNLAGRSDIPYGAAQQPDGKVVIVGRVANSGGADPDIGLARFNVDGSRDSTFGNDGVYVDQTIGSWDEAAGVALQADGKIVIVGTSSVSGLLARYDADGTPDSGFGNAGRVTVPQLGPGRAIALQSDGRILAAGVQNGDFVIARFMTDGQPDTSFGTSGVLTVDFFGASDDPSEIVIQPDGRILVAGSATNGTRRELGLVRILP